MIRWHPSVKPLLLCGPQCQLRLFYVILCFGSLVPCCYRRWVYCFNHRLLHLWLLIDWHILYFLFIGYHSLGYRLFPLLLFLLHFEWFWHLHCCRLGYLLGLNLLLWGLFLKNFRLLILWLGWNLRLQDWGWIWCLLQWHFLPILLSYSWHEDDFLLLIGNRILLCWNWPYHLIFCGLISLVRLLLIRIVTSMENVSPTVFCLLLLYNLFFIFFVFY